MGDTKEIMQEMARVYEQGLEYVVIMGGPDDIDNNDVPAMFVTEVGLRAMLHEIRSMNPDIKDENLISFIMSKSGKIEWRNVNEVFMYAKIKEILDINE